MLFTLFALYEEEGKRLLDRGLVLPAYDYVLKCSHIFNLLDAGGEISVMERNQYMGRIRQLANRSAQLYLEERKSSGFPFSSKIKNCCVAGVLSREGRIDGTRKRPAIRGGNGGVACQSDR